MKKTLFLITILLSTIGYCQSVEITFTREVRTSKHDDEKNYIEFDAQIHGIEINNSKRIKFNPETSYALTKKGDTLKGIPLGFFKDKYKESQAFTFKIQSPVKRQKSIHQINLNLKYFEPSMKNNSKVIIKSPIDYYFKNIIPSSHKDLCLVLLDKDYLLQETNNSEYEDRISKLPKVIQSKIWDKDIHKHLTDFFKRMSNDKTENSIIYILDHYEKRIINFNILNENGEIMNSGKSQSGYKNIIGLKENIKPNWSIEMIIENEDSIKNLNFKLENIILP